MTKEEISDAVKEIFHSTLKVEPGDLTPEASLRDDLNLDSLDMIEVVYEIEERFDVQIPEEKMKEITTYDQIIEGLTAALEAKG